MWVDLEDVFYQLKSLFFPPFALHSRSYSRLWQSIPGNGNGNTKLHSQILGTGTGMKNSIPNFWEREREWKNHSQFSGTGMGGRYSREWPGTGIPAHPCNQCTPVAESLVTFPAVTVMYLHIILNAGWVWIIVKQTTRSPFKFPSSADEPSQNPSDTFCVSFDKHEAFK